MNAVSVRAGSVSARLYTVVCAFLLLTVAGAPLAAQGSTSQEIRVDTGVDPDTVTVGEHFRSALRVTVPPGYRVEFEEIAANDTVEAASPVQRVDRADGGISALFEMVAWQTGDSLAATVPVRVIGADGEVTEHALPLAMPVVASVLPAEVEEVEPRPVKDLVAPPGTQRPFPWWWLLLAAAVAALLYAWWRWRRGSADRGDEDPREWALAELNALLAADDGEHETVELYRRGSWVLRSYLARVDTRLGTDLTTSEVVRAARVDGVNDEILRLLAVTLERADRVKFSAGHPAGLPEARDALERMRELVASYPPGSDETAMPSKAA